MRNKHAFCLRFSLPTIIASVILTVLISGCGGGGGGSSNPTPSPSSSTSTRQIGSYVAQWIPVDPQNISRRYDYRGVSQEGTLFLIEDGVTPGFTTLASTSLASKSFTPLIYRSPDGLTILAQGDVLGVAANGDAYLNLGMSFEGAADPFLYHRATGKLAGLPGQFRGALDIGLSSADEIYARVTSADPVTQYAKFTPDGNGNWTQSVLFSNKTEGSGYYYFAPSNIGGPFYGLELGQTPTILGLASTAWATTPSQMTYFQNGSWNMLPAPPVGQGPYPRAMNPIANIFLGQVEETNGDSHLRGVLWSAGKAVDVGRDMMPTGVNSSGTVVGSNYVDKTAFVWIKGTTYMAHITDTNGKALTGMAFITILDDQRVIGEIDTDTARHYYVLTPQW